MRVIQLVRHDARELFGVSFADHCGHFLDRYLSRMVHSFCDWTEYRRGDHSWEEDVSKGAIYAAVFSSDARYLFTASEKGSSITVWNVETQERIQECCDAHSRAVTCLAYHSGLLVSGSMDTTIRLWNYCDDITKDQQSHDEGSHHGWSVARIMSDHRSTVNSVDFDNNGHRIISASLDRSVRIWSVHNGRCLRVFRGHTRSVSAACFAGDTSILSGGRDSLMLEWRVKDGRVTHQFARQPEVRAVRVNCDASWLVCVTEAGIDQYRYPEIATSRIIVEHASGARFHPSNPYILAVIVSDHARTRFSVIIYNLRTARRLRSIEGHSRGINDVSFTPDGRYLASVSDDRSIRMWDVSHDFSDIWKGFVKPADLD